MLPRHHLRHWVAVGLGISLAALAFTVRLHPDVQPSVPPVYAWESCPSSANGCGSMTASLGVVHRVRVLGGGYEEVQPFTSTFVVVTPQYFTLSGQAGCPCDEALPSLTFFYHWDTGTGSWKAVGCRSKGINGGAVVASNDCSSLASPFTSLSLSEISSCEGTDEQSSKVTIAVGLSPTTTGICDVAATMGATFTYNATSAEFLVTNVSPGFEIDHNCDLDTSPTLHATKGAYRKSIPISCGNSTPSSTININFDD